MRNVNDERGKEGVKDNECMDGVKKVFPSICFNYYFNNFFYA